MRSSGWRWRASWRPRVPDPRPAAAAETPAAETTPGGIREALREVGLPRVLIGAFFVALLGVAWATHMNMPSLLGDCVLRIGRNGLLVLALYPAIQGGLG